MLERSALAGAKAGIPARWQGEGLSLEEQAGQGVVSLRLRAGPAMQLASAALGLDLDIPAGAASERAERAALRIGPDEWMIRCPRAGEAELAQSLRQALAGYPGAAAPLGNGTVVIDVAGPRARALLGKGASLDLHPSRFGPGRCAAAGFGKIRVVIWQRGPELFSMHVGRSFARSFWDWAVDVALEWAR